MRKVKLNLFGQKIEKEEEISFSNIYGLVHYSLKWTEQDIKAKETKGGKIKAYIKYLRLTDNVVLECWAIDNVVQKIKMYYK